MRLRRSWTALALARSLERLPAILLLICCARFATATEPKVAEPIDPSGPVPMSTPAPAYPDFAREAHIDGTVVLRVLVGREGRVEDVTILRGIAGLDEAAIEAVKKWTFKPAVIEGAPVAAWTAVPVIFQMSPRVTASPPSSTRILDAGSEPPGGAYMLGDVSIEMERTGCLGSCPEYSLLLRGTGACAYRGNANVQKQGEVAFRLEPSVVAELLDDLYGMDFFHFREFYHGRAGVRVGSGGTIEPIFEDLTDMSRQIVTVRIGTYVKRVERSAMTGPKELAGLGDRIDEVTKSAQWVGVRDAPSR